MLLASLNFSVASSWWLWREIKEELCDGSSRFQEAADMQAINEKFYVFLLLLLLFFSWSGSTWCLQRSLIWKLQFPVPCLYLRRTNCWCMRSIDWSSAPWLRNNERKLLNGWHLHLNTREHAICRGCPETCAPPWSFWPPHSTYCSSVFHSV